MILQDLRMTAPHMRATGLSSKLSRLENGVLSKNGLSNRLIES